MNIKKCILLLTFLFLSINLSACDEEFEENDPIVFSEAGVAMALHGYTTVSQIGTMSFYFKYDDYKVNSYFIHTTKELLSTIENYIILPRHPLRLRLTDGDITNYAFDPLNLAIYSHSDKNTLGWVVNFMFSGRIPVWLSVGIEAVAKSDMGLFMPDYYTITVPDHFGDLLFNPGFWGTEINKNAINIAYHFVRYLIEINELESLIEEYLRLQNGWDQANVLASQMFYNYFAYELDTAIVLDYMSTISTSAHNGYRLTIPSYLNVYNFIFSCFSQYRENIMNYIYALDTETLFVINWYSQFIDFEFTPINVNVFARTINPQFGGLADFSGNLINIYQFWVGAGMHGIMAHEVSHAINGQINRQPIAPLDEGLANVLMFQFFESEYNETYMFFLTVNYIQDNFGSDHRRMELLTNTWLRDMDMHFRAYYRLNHTDYVHGGGPFGTGSNGNIGFVVRYTNPNAEYHIAAINTYTTALSFVHYLITTYGAEYYMQVHWDVNNFENVYGKTIFELIEEWRSFLINLAVEEWDIFNELRDMAKELHELYSDPRSNITWSESWGRS